MDTRISNMLAEFGRLVQKAGPYVVLEVVLPGGTLFALLLYLHRTGQLRELCNARVIGRAIVRSAGKAFDQLAYGFRPYEPLPAAAHGVDEREALRPLDLRYARR